MLIHLEKEVASPRTKSWQIKVYFGMSLVATSLKDMSTPDVYRYNLYIYIYHITHKYLWILQSNMLFFCMRVYMLTPQQYGCIIKLNGCRYNNVNMLTPPNPNLFVRQQQQEERMEL